MIYFVDEDKTQLSPLKNELIIRDYNVKNLLNADEAYNILSKIYNNDVEIVIIDVMLSASTNHKKSRYDRNRSNDFTTTGICLLEDLTEANRKVFPLKAALLSMATDVKLVEEIKRAATKYSVPYWDKEIFKSAMLFADAIEKTIEDIRNKVEKKQ